uniref:Uncharacterized protein n=1 Tax=Sus scrofa TaxID=9823 RepID=A0A8D1JB68_PIG
PVCYQVQPKKKTREGTITLSEVNTYSGSQKSKIKMFQSHAPSEAYRGESTPLPLPASGSSQCSLAGCSITLLSAFAFMWPSCPCISLCPHLFLEATTHWI